MDESQTGSRWITRATTTVGSAMVWKGTTWHRKVVEIKSAAHVDWVLSTDVSQMAKQWRLGHTTGRQSFETSWPDRLNCSDHSNIPIIVGGVRIRSQRGSLRDYNLGLGAVATCRSTHFRQPSEELVMHSNTQRRPQVCLNALARPDTSRRIVAAHDVNIDQFNVATTSLVSRWKGDLHVPIHKIAAETSAATSG